MCATLTVFFGQYLVQELNIAQAAMQFHKNVHYDYTKIALFFIFNVLIALGIYAARKLGMKTTGNAGGVHNLTLRSGEKDLVGLLKAMGTGLLVTEVMGQGVNLITGDYSRGVAGFWVENGEIQYPVHEVTIAGKLQDMYAHIIDVGNDVDRRSGIHTGSILIEEMVIAGD